MDEYKRIKQSLRERFEADRTGDQHLFIEQTKLLEPLIKPLISTQEAMQASARQPVILRPALTLPEVPLEVSGLPETRAGLGPLAIGTEEETIRVDLDSGLDELDIHNLQLMGFELPSKVFKNIKQIERTIAKIKTENRRIGQKLGKGSDASSEEKDLYKSYKRTLENYREKIQGLEGAKQFVGKGIDVIYYPNVEDLFSKLTELEAAKNVGNTGLDNRIVATLDELLRTGAVTKNEYDSLYELIFS